MLEVIGNLIHNILSVEMSDMTKNSLISYFDILIERLRDTNSFVRVKVLNVLLKLAE